MQRTHLQEDAVKSTKAAWPIRKRRLERNKHKACVTDGSSGWKSRMVNHRKYTNRSWHRPSTWLQKSFRAYALNSSAEQLTCHLYSSVRVARVPSLTRCVSLTYENKNSHANGLGSAHTAWDRSGGKILQAVQIIDNYSLAADRSPGINYNPLWGYTRVAWFTYSLGSLYLVLP